MIVTTVSVEKLYRELLLELGVKKEDLYISYRKYLKQLILENVPGVFLRNRNMPISQRESAANLLKITQ